MEAAKYIYIFHLKSFKYDFYVHLKIVHLLSFSHKAATIWLPGECTFILNGVKCLEAPFLQGVCFFHAGEDPDWCDNNVLLTNVHYYAEQKC